MATIPQDWSCLQCLITYHTHVCSSIAKRGTVLIRACAFTRVACGTHEFTRGNHVFYLWRDCELQLVIVQAQNEALTSLILSSSFAWKAWISNLNSSLIVGARISFFACRHLAQPISRNRIHIRAARAVRSEKWNTTRKYTITITAMIVGHLNKVKSTKEIWLDFIILHQARCG